MFCAKCGAQIANGATFCGKCGSPVSKSAGIPAPAGGAPANIGAGQLGTGYPGAGYPTADGRLGARAGGVAGVVARVTGNTGVVGIVKVVAVAAVIICLFLPWFQISIDQYLDLANTSLQQFGSSASPFSKLGSIGVSVFTLGDFVNFTNQLIGWIQQNPSFGMSSDDLAMIGIFSQAALLYRLFGLLWIASILVMVAGATLSIIARKGDRVLRCGAIVCAAASVITVIFALVVDGLIATPVSSAMSSTLYYLPNNALAPSGVFGFTPAPIVVLVASIAVFVCSYFEGRAR